MASRRSRGFVLPTTLMVMTLLTVMLTAAFTLISAEYRTTDNSFGRSRAHALAEAGLANYLSGTPNLGGSLDSVRYTLTGGYVDVIARRLRDSTSSKKQVWLIRATAYASDPYQSGQVQGQRTVAQLATFNPATFPAQAGLFAANGVYVEGMGGQNPIEGVDGACGTPVLADALVTAPGGYSEENAKAPDPDATAPKQSIRYESDAAAVVASSRINWPALIAGDFTPDYTLPAGPVVWSGYPVVLIQGDYTLSGSTPGMVNPGKGIIVVTGNLTLGSGFRWEGLVLVGGYLTYSTGNPQIHGLTITGLNIALGATVPPDTLKRNMRTWWSSCDLDDALSSLGSLVPIGNAWVDTWSAY